MATRTKTGGRKAGTPNKMPSDLRKLIIGALAEAGGQAYLAQQAVENPAAFMTLLGKILPKEIKAEIAAVHVVQKMTPDEVRGVLEAALGDSKGCVGGAAGNQGDARQAEIGDDLNHRGGLDPRRVHAVLRRPLFYT